MKKTWGVHTPAEYHEAKRRVTEHIIKRLIRGNVSAQNGKGSAAAKWLARSRDADEQMKTLEKLVEAS